MELPPGFSPNGSTTTNPIEALVKGALKDAIREVVEEVIDEKFQQFFDEVMPALMTLVDHPFVSRLTHKAGKARHDV